eukprot:m.73435 g.73435  ORF g.73435 m.73435 type:complete len:651 (+) comp14458_c0_seq1:41-1993(+)
MDSNKRLCVSLEPHHDNRVHSIGHDSQETAVVELGSGQRAFQIINRLDFSDVVDDSEEADKTLVKASRANQEINPGVRAAWEGVHRRIHNACAEVERLCDVLSLVRKTDYMHVYHVQAPAPKPNVALRLASKKAGLASASSRLAEAAASLRATLAHQALAYREIGEVRRQWRVRSSQTALLVEFGAQSCGSSFSEKGEAEMSVAAWHSSGVARERLVPALRPASASTAATADSQQQPQQQQESLIALDVPARFRALATLHLHLTTDTSAESRERARAHALRVAASRSTHATATDSSVPSPSSSQPERSWARHLVRAHNNYFCRDLLANMLRDAARNGGTHCRVLGTDALELSVPGMPADARLVLQLVHGPLLEQADAAVGSAMDTDSCSAAEVAPCDGVLSPALREMLSVLLQILLRQKQKAKVKAESASVRSAPSTETDRLPPLLTSTTLLVQHLFSRSSFQASLAGAIRSLQATVSLFHCAVVWHTQPSLSSSSCTLQIECGSSNRRDVFCEVRSDGSVHFAASDGSGVFGAGDARGTSLFLIEQARKLLASTVSRILLSLEIRLVKRTREFHRQSHGNTDTLYFTSLDSKSYAVSLVVDEESLTLSCSLRALGGSVAKETQQQLDWNALVGSTPHARLHYFINRPRK